VVILRVVLEDLGLLLVVEVPYKIVHLELFPPFFAINEPARTSAEGYIYSMG